jgi:hypothetical protein
LFVKMYDGFPGLQTSGNARPACRIVNFCPAIFKFAVRGKSVVPAVKETVPLPVRVPGLLMFSQGAAAEVAVQLQPACVVTVKLPLTPAALKRAPEEDSVYEHCVKMPLRLTEATLDLTVREFVVKPSDQSLKTDPAAAMDIVQEAPACA